jgi:ubiquinone/menaquinone biosynthesis C-methylase UbiE
LRDEISRISEAYLKRKALGKSNLYSYFNPSALFIRQKLERTIIKYLHLHEIHNLSEKRILDVGCGTGPTLRDFIQYGANPKYLNGIDLLSERLETAVKLSPNINLVNGDASILPYKDKSIDIIMQRTVFTSILDNQMKRNIAKEMLRVLKPDGIIIWYDFYMNNPKNSDVKGVKKQEIYALFPDCNICLERITLAPPLIRIISVYSWFLCYLLEKLKILNTHYIGIIKRDHN